MKSNWKSVLLYALKILEMLITGAAGGMAASL